MWRYQKPGFETLLVAELQRQQQGRQFCDTLLKAEGVSVPAHSCVLSAVSPQLSTSLSSTPAPPAGQARLLEFGGLGAGTLLHMVRLLYSGEMAGEGEKEKQEAISAAAKLGIHELLEVTGTGRDGGSRRAEAGVQTEPAMPEERQTGRATWRREVKDGSTFLWKATLSVDDKDSWTQTEDPQVNAAPPSPSPPVASFETIDLTSLQSLVQTNCHVPHPHISYVPIPPGYADDGSQTLPLSSAPAVSSQEFFAAEYTALAPPLSLPPLPGQAIQWAAEPRDCWAGLHAADRDVAAGDSWEDERLEQFQGNIPEFINHFLKLEKEKGPSRGRVRGGRAEGARRAGTAERRARRPQAARGRRGRGGLTQTVDVQEVGVSRLQKLFQQRGGVLGHRPGQGGGAVGRKLHLTTREHLKPGRRRRACRKSVDFGPAGESLPHSSTAGRGRGGGVAQRGRRNAPQEVKQDVVAVSRAQRARAKSATSPPAPACSHLTFPSPSLRLPAAPYASPAASLLHTTALPPLPPPLPPPPHEDQPDLFDHLLEEVMMGLNIIPNDPPTGGGMFDAAFCRSGPQSHTAGPNAGQCFHGSAEVAAVGRACGGSGATSGRVPALQSQGEGELTEMLDHFLQSFEQQTNSCTSRKAASRQPQRAHKRPRCAPGAARLSQRSERPQSEGEAPQRHSKRSAASAAPPGRAEASSGKRPRRRRKTQYPFSLEKHNTRKPKSDAKAETAHECAEKQLRQMPVVKLERSIPLPVEVTSRRFRRESREAESSTEHPRARLANPRVTRIYPIRSRFKVAQIPDRQPAFEPPLAQTPPHRAPKRGGKRGRPKTKGMLPSFVNDRIRPKPDGPGGDDERDREEDQRGEATQSARRAAKRRADSEQEMTDDASVAKSACVKQPTSTSAPSSSASALAASEAAAAHSEEDVDVEAVWLTSDGETLPTEEAKARGAAKPAAAGAGSDGEDDATDEGIHSEDETVAVDGDSDASCQPGRAADEAAAVRPPVSPPSRSPKEANPGWDEDDDVDVVGGSAPTPDPVVISWTDSSDGEEEEGDIDVVGGGKDRLQSVSQLKHL